jgi:hypothetical protein
MQRTRIIDAFLTKQVPPEQRRRRPDEGGVWRLDAAAAYIQGSDRESGHCAFSSSAEAVVLRVVGSVECLAKK